MQRSLFIATFVKKKMKTKNTSCEVIGLCNRKIIVPKYNHVKKSKTCKLGLVSLTLGASFL